MKSQPPGGNDGGAGNPTLSLEIESAPFDIEEEEFNLRKTVANRIILLFGCANSVVFIMVAILGYFDVAMISEGRIISQDRIINSNVVVSLIAATAAQLGTIAFTVTSHFFPKNGKTIPGNKS